MNYMEFSFLVEAMTEEQADELLDEIISKVEALGLKMAGGFNLTTDADY
ncbi:MAG TPA: hypothetical protein VIK64_12790 [Anaerolineales bacterium]